MFINPKRAIDEKWITGIVDAAKQVQPNAIDFTLDTLKLVDSKATAIITEAGKVMRPLSDVEVDADGNWLLKGGRVYDGTSNMFVKVPKNVASVLYTRSTFTRNGVFIVSGLYDTGYEGHIGFTIYTMGGPIKIAPGTRIGQIGFMFADAAGQYAGAYNHQQGTHYAEPNKPQQQGSPQTPPVTAPPFLDALAGQREIPFDPRRTEAGMGPIIGTNSKYI